MKEKEFARKVMVTFMTEMVKKNKFHGDAYMESMRIVENDEVFLKHLKIWVEIFTKAKDYVEEQINSYTYDVEIYENEEESEEE